MRSRFDTAVCKLHCCSDEVPVDLTCLSTALLSDAASVVTCKGSKIGIYLSFLEFGSALKTTVLKSERGLLRELKAYHDRESSIHVDKHAGTSIIEEYRKSSAI